MSASMIRIDPEKIKGIIEGANINLDQASLMIGKSHSYLDKAVQRGRLSKEDLDAFCNAFGVEETDVRRKRNSGGEVQLNVEKCKELITQNGYTVNEASIAIGYANKTLSAAFAIGALNIEGTKALADLLNVPWESLTKNVPPAVKNKINGTSEVVFQTQKKFKEVTITPEVAQKMLDTMGVNRKLRTIKVNQIKEDLLNNRYMDDPDLIAFDINGHLINGQHRLHAIIEANVTIVDDIVYNLEREKTVIDTGTHRSTLDTGVFQGSLAGDIANNKNVSAMNVFMRVKMGVSKQKVTSDLERINLINEYKDELLRVQNIIKGIHDPICDRSYVRAGLLGAVLYGIDDETLSRFCDRVNTGIVYSPQETAASQLNVYLHQTRARGRDDTVNAVSIVEQAIQDFVAGKPRRKMYKPGPHPYIKPDKEDTDG